jgi:DNA-binding NarL/FixJ family response regulator
MIGPDVPGGFPAPGLTVGLVEDHALFREGLRLVLQNADGIEVIGEAESPSGAFDLMERRRPDVLLVDLSLGELDGMPLVQSLTDRYPDSRVLVVSMHRHPETVRQAFMAGAAGYVVKGARASELIDAIRAVARGERYIHSSVAADIIRDSLRWQESGQSLTAREREILGHIAAGEHAPDIGRELGISENTVRRHIANLAEKLGIRGIGGLRQYAAQHGFSRGDRP